MFRQIPNDRYSMRRRADEDPHPDAYGAEFYLAAADAYALEI
jgi:hypothetical protein